MSVLVIQIENEKWAQALTKSTSSAGAFSLYFFIIIIIIIKIYIKKNRKQPFL